MVPEQMYICEIIQQILSNIAHFPYSKNDERSDLLSEIQDKIAIVSNNLNKLKNDQKRLRDRLSRSQSSLQVLAQNLSSCEISFEEHSSLINGLKINESLYRQEVWSLKKKIEEQRLTSFDGTLIWKIPCLDEKIGS
jgi:chromosome segregation ATPase